MDKSGIFAGITVGSVSTFIIFSILFIIPAGSDETIIEMQNQINENEVQVQTQIDENEVQVQTQIDKINNLILEKPKTLSLIEIFEKSEPGVVRVNTQTNNGTGGVGSGFVFDKKGHIITNAHVIDDATKIIITFLDGRSYNAEIIGMDKYTDIGVIKVNADLKLLHPLSLGDS
ncbi:MAG: trypsin-like peptidase domain-containing protein, partial [Candidatus Nitrosopumilus limneticus]|nr:trypsin-like peptidase domain-containing protein [Candidatus Nitrosopumilus limneticus]